MQTDFESYLDEIDEALRDDKAALEFPRSSSSAKPLSVFDKYGFYSVSDLTDEERKPPEFIIDDMLPVGVTFLSGPPKTRKSFLALQMAIAVATGTPFWGRKVLQCEVAYYDLEGSKSRISTRTDHMSTPIPPSVHIRNKGLEKGEQLADGLVDKIAALHRACPQLRLVIIDTYSRARGYVRAGGGNAYDADVRLLEPIQQMALKENIAILFVHHDKKGAALASDSLERLSGTMGISGSADCVINLVPVGKRYTGRATLEYNPRDGKGGELAIEFDESRFEWTEAGAPNLKNSPVCAWVIANRGVKGCEGRFWSYEEVFQEAYHYRTDTPGNRVHEDLRPALDELYLAHRIGVQLGVKSNGSRGIRIINLE